MTTQASCKKTYTIAELRKFPGFDEVRHNASLVEESVEPRKGQLTVVYRTNANITKTALKNFKIPAFKLPTF